MTEKFRILNVCKSCLWILLLAFCIVPAYADVDFSRNYLNVTLGKMTPAHNYIDISFGVREEKGPDDVLRDIHIYVGRTYNTGNVYEQVEMAYLPYEDSEINYVDTQYGAIEWMGNTTKKEVGSKMVYANFRFYPSTLVMEYLSSICVKGWWDIDNKNKKTEGCEISWATSLQINFYKHYHITSNVTKVDYERRTDGYIDCLAEFETDTMSTPGWQRCLNIHDNYGYSEPPTLGCLKIKNSDTKARGALYNKYALDFTKLTHVYLTYQKTQKVNAGKPNAEKKMDSAEVFQMFCPDDTHSIHKEIPYCKGPGSFLLADNTLKTELKDRFTFRYDGSAPVKPRLYRRLASEPISATKFVSEGTPVYPLSSSRYGYFDISMEDMQFDTEYVYYLTLYPEYWKENERVAELADSLTLNVKLSEVFDWGDGTKESPYGIRNLGHLHALSKYVDMNFPTEGLCWIQRRDIDFNWNESFVPIGASSARPFKGSYNGNGFRLKLLNIDDQNLYTAGMFGYVRGDGLPEEKRPVLENIYISMVHVDAKQGMGILAGDIRYTKIRNCRVEGDILASAEKDFVGGLVSCALYSDIENCSFFGSVSGHQMVGGISGFLSYCNVKNCYVDATVSGVMEFGAFSGRYSSGSLVHCYYNDTKSEDMGAVGLSDLTGTALASQMGIESWNYVSEQYPIQKVFDEKNPYDVTLIEEKKFGEIAAEIPDASVLCRVAKGQQYTPIVLPFALTAEQVSQTGRFYTYRGSYSGEGRNIIFLQEVTETEANEPYFFERLNSGYDYHDIKLDKITLMPADKMPDASIAPSTEGLVGSYKEVGIPNGGYEYKRGLNDLEPYGKFVKAESGTPVLPMSAYLWCPSFPDNVQEVEIMLFDSTSDVQKVVSDIENGKNGIYNLKGQRLAAPQEGINIIDGKKVFKLK